MEGGDARWRRLDIGQIWGKDQEVGRTVRIEH